jgi:hypothetical protein
LSTTNEGTPAGTPFTSKMMATNWTYHSLDETGLGVSLTKISIFTEKALQYSTFRALASQHKASPSHDRENMEKQETIGQHSNTNPHIDVYLALMIPKSVLVPEPQLNSILYSPKILFADPMVPRSLSKVWQAITLSISFLLLDVYERQHSSYVSQAHAKQYCTEVSSDTYSTFLKREQQ